jgi:hypothetical protein
MQRFRTRLRVFVATLVCGAAASAQQAPAPDAAQLDVNLARKGLANTARLACLIEYDDPDMHAQLMSIGWETGAFCSCVETKLLVSLSDDVTKEAAIRILRTQNALKTPADLARLSSQPQVAEYLRQTNNAKGNCIYVKMRR